MTDSVTDKRPLILVTNDDGVASRGIAHLVETISPLGRVVVVAPATPQSAKSSALTADSALVLTRHEPIAGAEVFSVNGTPVDCVKIAMHAVLDRRPDMVVAGINHGSNAAVNNIYSGTMGATMEGCILGIPSVGFSLLSHRPDADFSGTTPFVLDIMRRVLAGGLPAGICLNVNFPARCTPKGLKVVRSARGHWTEEYADFSTPSGKPFYWLTGKFDNLEPDDPATDEYWLAREWGTIVPIRPDQTAADMIGDISKLMSAPGAE